jgi:hypothetical protein
MASVDAVLIPVASATTVPPTNGWAGFDLSARGGLQACEVLFAKLWYMENVTHHLSFSSSVSVKNRISKFLWKRRRNDRSTP